MPNIENVEILQKHRHSFILGPPMLLLLFAQALTGPVLVDLIVHRTCLVSFDMTQANCSMLRTNASSAEAQKLEAEIQRLTTVIIMAKSLVESILPAMLSLFLGPWSDRGGRRPLLVGGFTGYTLMYVMLFLMCNWNISPWYLLIPSILAYMLGGSGIIILAAACYVSDTSVEKNRTMRLAGIEVSALTGFVLGLFTGPIIYNNYGYAIIFSTAAICCILASFYVYLCVPESVKDTAKDTIFGLFEVSIVKKLVTSLWLRREGFHRPVAWLAISMSTILLMIIKGEHSIEYLFTRQRLHWDVQQYSYVTGASVVLNVVGLFCGVWLFSRVLELSDTVIVAIGLTSNLGAAITKSLTSQTWHMYLALSIKIFSRIPVPVIRSIISKSVPAQDLGKVFSLTSSMEMLSPLGGAPLYTLIYSNYLPPIYPAPVYLVSASLYLLLILLIIWTGVLIRNSRSLNYVTLP